METRLVREVSRQQPPPLETVIPTALATKIGQEDLVQEKTSHRTGITAWTETPEVQEFLAATKATIV